jgi:plastocyanin
MMNARSLVAGTLMALVLCASASTLADPSPYYLPDETASKTVSVVPSGAGAPAQSIVVLTTGVAIKETGPVETVDKFGEVYAFSPNFIAVQQDTPVRISFWNLQTDDMHDVMLGDPDWQVLMHVMLPPLEKVTYDFTFHRPGIYPFVCTMHGPAMSGQILVLSASSLAAAGK